MYFLTLSHFEVFSELYSGWIYYILCTVVLLSADWKTVFYLLINIKTKKNGRHHKIKENNFQFTFKTVKYSVSSKE